MPPVRPLVTHSLDAIVLLVKATLEVRWVVVDGRCQGGTDAIGGIWLMVVKMVCGGVLGLCGWDWKKSNVSSIYMADHPIYLLIW